MDINRRQFLKALVPVVGVVAVAPSILVPTRKFWDMGAAWTKRGVLLGIDPGTSCGAAISFTYNGKVWASSMIEVSCVEKGGYPMRRFSLDGKEIQMDQVTIHDVTLILPSNPSTGDKITAVYKKDLTHSRVSVYQDNA